MKTLKTLFILINLTLLLKIGVGQEIEKYVLKDIFELKTTRVKDQQNSEACWSFAASSFIESELIRKDYPELNISEMFFVRQMYIQRAIDYVRYKGCLHFGNGGHVHDVFNELNKYGFIPQEDYAGNEYDPGFMDLSELDSLAHLYLDDVVNKKEKNWMPGYTELIEKYLGKVPEKFTYNEKEYTPVEFFQSFDFNPDDYVEITSYNHQPFYEPFVLELPDNWSHNSYYNVPLDEFIEIMNYSLNQGITFVWNGDVANEGFYYFLDKEYKNICIAPDENSKEKERIVTQEYRQMRFDEQTVSDEHLLHVFGLAKDETEKMYYKSKNSWGVYDVYFGGYQYMTEQYLRLYTVSITVHKDAIPDQIKEKLGL